MQDYLSAEYWNVAFDPRRPIRSTLVKILRITLSSIKGFNQDECSLRASALTFYTLLSIVPVLAVALGIAKGFGLQDFLERQLMNQFYEQREFVTKAIEFSYSLLKNTQSSLITGIGVIVLFWTVLQVLSNIEDAFNAIWHVHQSRSLGRKISDYLAMMLLSPFFFIASSSLFVYAISHLTLAFQGYAFGKMLSPFFELSVQLFPILLTWLLFTFLYIFMPNTQVDFKSGLIAGVLTGTVYQVVQWIYIKFQIGVASYGAIYGSFAAIPLFLVWLYVSWLIILFGAEVSYHHQNDVRTRISSLGRRCKVSKQLLGTLLTWICVKNFNEMNQLLKVDDLANFAGINVTTAQEILDELTNSEIIAEVITGPKNERTYHPARDGRKITLKNVSDALNDSRKLTYFTTCGDKADNLEKILNTLDETSHHSAANLNLEELKI